MQAEDRAVELFSQGFNCAQSVFAAHAVLLGMTEESALKLATPFGGGMARMQLTCGAFTGALLAIGLRCGRATLADEAARESSYGLSRLLADHFRNQFHSLACRDLVGYDLSTEAGSAQAKAHNVHGLVCEPIVRDMARVLGQILKENCPD